MQKSLNEIYKEQTFGNSELSLVNNATILNQLTTSSYGGSENGTFILLDKSASADRYAAVEQRLRDHGLNPINPMRWKFGYVLPYEEAYLRLRRSIYTLAVFCSSVFIGDCNIEDLDSTLLALASDTLTLSILRDEDDIQELIGDIPF